MALTRHANLNTTMNLLSATLCVLSATQTLCLCKPKWEEEKKNESQQKKSRFSADLAAQFSPIMFQDVSLPLPFDGNASLSEQVRRSFQTTQQNLGVKRVDSLLLHGPYESLDDTMVAWRALEAIHASGGARQLGISNFYSADLLRAFLERVAVKPSVLQNRFHVQTQHNFPLLPLLAEHGIILQTFWTLTGNPEFLANAEFRQMAQRYALTAEQLLFAFLFQRGVYCAQCWRYRSCASLTRRRKACTPA